MPSLQFQSQVAEQADTASRQLVALSYSAISSNPKTVSVVSKLQFTHASRSSHSWLSKHTVPNSKNKHPYSDEVHVTILKSKDFILETNIRSIADEDLSVKKPVFILDDSHPYISRCIFTSGNHCLCSKVKNLSYSRQIFTCDTIC